MRRRAAGLLVHPTALPGPFGVGDLGPATVRLLDRLTEAGLAVWQVLPLGPPGPGHSPYACRSAFAGNPLLISPRRLVHSGWLAADRVDAAPVFPRGHADFDAAARWKEALFRESWKQFRGQADSAARHDLDAFVEAPEQRGWLEDWVLFAALHSHHEGRSWTTWDTDLRQRSPFALDRARRELEEEISYRRYLQFLFHRQWATIRDEARARNMEILGDLPFYPALDSADVWSHPELFRLDDHGRPTKVAGVPPDYFSETGQLWGNPVFDWDRMAADGYDWWIERIAANLRWMDRLRLDHFRAFVAYWEVDAGDETATNGVWKPGPGRPLFDALERRVPGASLVAEDLGDITPDVEELRDELELPGMYVLQFGFDESDDRHGPERHGERGVVYTGTHDNDTTRGWFENLPPDGQQRVLAKLDCTADDVVWAMIEAALRSPAELAVFPLQDVLGLGSEARMNRPGEPVGNWDWRAARHAVSLRLVARVREMLASAGRLGGS